MSVIKSVNEIAALEVQGTSAGPPLVDLVRQFEVNQLVDPLPPRDYLLWSALTTLPVLMRGKVALLAGKGGVGKTMLLLMLAVAIATGRHWPGAHGWLTKPGRVLIALAEEDAAEVQRRLHDLCVALQLSAAELAQVSANVVILPLAGVGVAFTHADDAGIGHLPETERPEQMREILRAAKAEGRPFDLVILDPLSRFAGPDVEIDNSSATRFIQVLETLTAPDCGSPAVLVAHHLRKATPDEDKEASELIRGSVGLVDAVRWAAIVVQLKPLERAPDLLRVRVVKSNYTAIPDPLVLCRPRDGRGVLRVATPQELVAYDSAKGAAKDTKRAPSVEAKADAVLAVLREGGPNPEGITKKVIRGHVGGADELVSAAVDHLVRQGLIRKLGDKFGYVLTDGGVTQ